MHSNKLAGVRYVNCVHFLPDSFISEGLSFPLLALIQIRAFSGVTTKRQSPGSLLSHAKNNVCCTFCGCGIRSAGVGLGVGIP